MGLGQFYDESGAVESSYSKGLPPVFAQWHHSRLKKNTERSRRYRHLLKQHPDKYRRYREKQMYEARFGQYFTDRSAMIQTARSAEALLMYDEQSQPIRKNTLYQRKYRERLKQNPELYRRYRRLQSQYEKKCREKRKHLQEQFR
ncbi:hypothetical protein ACOMHN_036069 [Nucella lapillus]